MGPSSPRSVARADGSLIPSSSEFLRSSQRAGTLAQVTISFEPDLTTEPNLLGILDELRVQEPIGHRPESPDVMYDLSRDVWAKDFRERQPDVSMETIEKYLHNLYRVRPDFVYSVSRDFAKSCVTPMLVLPDDIVAHPLQVSIAIASLAPNAEITVFPWKEPPELKARTINRARTFLKRYQTA